MSGYELPPAPCSSCGATLDQCAASSDQWEVPCCEDCLDGRAVHSE